MDIERYRRGIQLFNQRHFYDAHEIWEDAWRDERGPERKFLQGLIQVAVALHHHSTGNLVGACSLLERGGRNLNAYPGEFCGIRLTELLASTSQWRAAMISGSDVPAFPRIDEID